MQLSEIPGKLVLPWATAGNKNSIPVASQIGITAGAASLSDGFPPLTMTPVAAGGVPPSGLDMNGILYEMSAILRWANAGGGYIFDAGFAADTNVGGYPKGARVMRSDGLGYWFNTVDNNTTDPETPGADVAGWVPDFQSGVAAVAMTSANVTLNPMQYGKPTIAITGALTSDLNLIFPAIAGQQWAVINGTTGNYNITAKTSGGVGIVIPQGFAGNVLCDGVNIVSKLADIYNSSDLNKGAAMIPGAIQVVSTMAKLRTITGNNTRRMYLMGNLSDGDGGQGFFYWSPASVTADNGGTVINPTGNAGAGRWIRQYSGPVNPRWFGAIGDGTSHPLSAYFGTLAAAQAIYPHALALTDEIDWAAIQAALNWVNSNLFGAVLVDYGVYLTTRPLLTYGGVTLDGVGPGATTIKKTAATGGTGTSLARTSTVTDSYTGDDILQIWHAANGYAYNAKVRNIYLVNSTYRASSRGVFAPRLSQCSFENVYVQNVTTGYQTYDAWLCTLRRWTNQAVAIGFQHADDGTGNGTGTSCLFEDCWINFDNSVVAPTIGYDFYGLTYSNLASTAADHCKQTGSTATAVYKFNLCNAITMNGCGMEDAKGFAIYATYSSVVINGLRTYQMYGDASWTTVATVFADNSKLTLTGCNFDPTTSPGGILNWVIQNGSHVVEMNPTASPSGGNTFIGYTGGSTFSRLVNGAWSHTNSSATTTPIQTTYTQRLEKGGKTVLSAGSAIFTVTAPGANSMCSLRMRLTAHDAAFPNGGFVQDVNFVFCYDGAAYYQNSAVVSSIRAGNSLTGDPTFSIARSGNVWTVTCTPPNGDMAATMVIEQVNVSIGSSSSYTVAFS